MATKWTEEQQQVIDLRDCNLLVSAAAGSGKTAVLVERILSKIMNETHPTDIDRLLIVTFTNAAAGEMRDRIRSAIENKIEELSRSENEHLLDHLQRQIALLQNAQIATIHSFCQYVIRNHFHTIDLDPGLRIADEGEQKLLQHDVLEKLLEEKYAEGDDAFLAMAEALAPGRDDRALTEIVLSLYLFSQSFPQPEKWLEACCRLYEISSVKELDETQWIAELMRLSTGILTDVQERIEETMQIAEDADGPYLYLPALQDDADFIEELLTEQSYSRRSSRLRTFEGWTRLSVKKDSNISEEKRKRAKELRDEYKKTVDDIKKEFFYAEPEILIRQMQDAAPMMQSVTGLTAAFAQKYAEEKIKKNLMDFNDLEHFALQILVSEKENEIRPTAVADDFADYFEEIMIDEYQDSNLVQEMILTSISKVRKGIYNLFMVGDVKQSIYKFRLARPELFMEKYHSYSVDEGVCRRIDLHKNFRSRSQVLKDVNFLFEQLMAEDMGGIAYDEAAALYPGAVFETGDEASFRNTEVLLVEPDIELQEEQSIDCEIGEKTAEIDAAARELEARATAGRIREIVGRELVWDKEEQRYRPARYSDIVILLRTISGWADVFAEELKNMDVPASTGARTGYFSTVEVQTVLSLLQIIDNPCQDIPLTAVLHSPIGNLDAVSLADIRSRHPQQPFYEACMEEESLQEFFSMLQEFRELAVYTPIHELLWMILDRTGYGAYAAAMPGGSQRQANLEMLVEKAIAYEAGSYRGLYNFIRYIENLHKYDVDFGEATLASEQENTVRIMSIHKSKGLEFPIVFVCGMGKQIDQSDAGGALITHADLGIGCDCIDLQLRIRTATLLKRFLKRQTVLENLGEELRVLYVALTRAKEKLILTGTITKLEEKLRKYSSVCGRSEVALSFTNRAGARTYWDWILPALLRNKKAQPLLHTYELGADRRHPLYERETNFQIREISAWELMENEVERQQQYHMSKEQLLGLPLEAVFDEMAARELAQHMSFQYFSENEAAIPSKVSVSELKKLAQYESSEDGQLLYEETVPIPLIPEFLQKEREITGAARGTIYHKLMECLDFKKFLDADDHSALLENEIHRLRISGHLNEEEAALIERRKILCFLASPLAVRMQKAHAAGRLFRERQFVLGMNASDIKREWSREKQVLIQGIIDAFFVEEGEIVLLDYKTDFVKFKEASSLYRKYGVQLDYYKQALERLMDLPVKEQLIYSFCLDIVITGEEHD